LKYYEALVKDGKLVFTDVAKFKAELTRLAGKRVYVSLETERALRSIIQNKYWFGVVVETFRAMWSKRRTEAGLPPYTKEQIHDVLVQVLLGTEEGPVLGSRVSVPTRNLSPADFSTLIDKARQMARDDYAMEIPEPGELEVTV
jgi:hypothetical protein